MDICKICTSCKNEKPLAYFSKQAEGKYGFTALCKRCASEKKKLFKASNPQYQRWLDMLDRCYRQKNKSFLNYGGRGITIFFGWHGMAGYEAFRDYVSALPNAGLEGMSIDRFPNKDGNYEPGNIRWATRAEQRHNQRHAKNGQEIKSLYFGVHWQTNKWKARVERSRKIKFLGYHPCQHKAYSAVRDYLISIGEPLNVENEETFSQHYIDRCKGITDGRTLEARAMVAEMGGTP